MEESEYIEKYFEKPLDEETAMRLHIAIGHRRGNGLLLNQKNQCVGFKCHEDDFEEVRKMFGMTD